MEQMRRWRAPPSCRWAVGILMALVVGAATSPAEAQETVNITLIIKNHVFDQTEIKVPVGKPIVILVKNQDPSAEEFESNSLSIEKVLPGNSEGTFRVKPLAKGRYTFIGEYHQDTAHGALVAE